MEEDEMLKRMTRLLEQGCTMLASHHDCGAPLFRCKGEIICPVCTPLEGDVTAAGAKPVSKGPLVPGKQVEQMASPKGPVQPGPQSGEVETSSQEQHAQAKELLRQALLNRLRELTGCVESEGDLGKMSLVLDCIERILRILSAL